MINHPLQAEIDAHSRNRKIVARQHALGAMNVASDIQLKNEIN